MTSITIDKREWELAQAEIHDLRSLRAFAIGEYKLVTEHGFDAAVCVRRIHDFAQKLHARQLERFQHVMQKP